ncbi:MAG TPA: extracellular solute-binding protein [Clostridiales bacterium]|nr:extracellular solute-binding protein [Clostridiales bacterium]
MTWSYADRKNSIDLFIKTALERHNVKINLENFPTAQYNQTVKVRASANELPELLEIHSITSGYALPLIEQSMLLPLNGIVNFDRFIPDAVTVNTTADGKTYCITPQAPLIGLLYNKKVFEECGVSVPKDKEEFEQVCNAIKAKGIAPIAMGAKDAWSLHFIAILGVAEHALKEYSSTDAIAKLKSGELRVNSPGFIKGFSLIREFYEKGWFQKNPLGTDVNAACEMLANGQAAMHINGTWQYTPITQANPEADIGFIPLPLNEKGTKSTVVATSGGGLALKNIEDPEKLEAAKKAIQLYHDVDMLTALIIDMKGIPTHMDVKVEDKFIAEASAFLTQCVVQANYESGLQPGHKTNRQTECQSILSGKRTAEDFLNVYDQEEQELRSAAQQNS